MIERVLTSPLWLRSGDTLEGVRLVLGQTFRLDHPLLRGLVQADDADGIRIGRNVEIVGRTTYDPFWNSKPADNYTNLVKLSGFHLRGCRRVTIENPSVDGLPYAGLEAQGCVGVDVRGFRGRRLAYPIHANHEVVYRGQANDSWRISDTRISDLWLWQSHVPPRTTRPFIPAGATVGQGGEIVMSGKDWQLLDTVHVGDGVNAWKVSGTDWVVRGGYTYKGFASGYNIADQAAPQYQGPEYAHLRAARGLIEDYTFAEASGTGDRRHDLLRVSFPFTEPLRVRRCVFSRDPQSRTITRAAGINWADVIFEQCEFVGWPEVAAAMHPAPAPVEIGVEIPGQKLGSATFDRCRAWGS